MVINKNKIILGSLLLGSINLYAGEPVTVVGNTNWPIEAMRFAKEYGLATENFIFNKSSQLMLQYRLSQGQVADMAKKALGSTNPLVNSTVDVFSNCVSNVTGKLGIGFKLPDLGKVCGQDITQVLVNAVSNDVSALHDKFKAWLLNPDTWRKTIDSVKDEDKDEYSSDKAYAVCLSTVVPKGKFLNVNVDGKTIKVYTDYCSIPDSTGKMVNVPKTLEGARKYCKHIDFNSKSQIKLLACQQILGGASSNSITALSDKATIGNETLLGPIVGKSTQVRTLYKQMKDDSVKIQENSVRLEKKDMQIHNIVYDNMLNSSFLTYNNKGKSGKIKKYVEETRNVQDSFMVPITLPYFNTAYAHQIDIKNGKSSKKGYTLTSQQMGKLQGGKPLVASIGLPIFTDNKNLLIAADKGKTKDYDNNLDKFIKFYQKVTKKRNSQTVNFLKSMKLGEIVKNLKRDKNNQPTFNYAVLSQLGYLESLLAYKSVDGPNGGDSAKYLGLTNLLGGILYQLHLINLQLYTYHKTDAEAEYYKWMFLKNRLLDIQKSIDEFKIANSVFLQRILQK